MGHFGMKPIRQAWFGLVLPGLVLNYLGQGALLLRDPAAAANPFYRLAPGWAQYPLVVLATAAAVIASQALISGVYSLTMQAVQLGFLPRLGVTHTSSQQRGQIYVPLANWLLLVACIALVLGFGSSSRLAAAYGIAVTLTMVITTMLFCRRGPLSVALGAVEGHRPGRRFFWVWSWPIAEPTFLKWARAGGCRWSWAEALFAIMVTWRKGRELLRERLKTATMPLDLLMTDLQQRNCSRAPGTAVFMSGDPRGAPLALLHNLKHNAVLHERNVILTIIISEEARVEAARRVQVQDLGHELLPCYRALRVHGTAGMCRSCCGNVRTRGSRSTCSARPSS